MEFYDDLLHCADGSTSRLLDDEEETAAAAANCYYVPHQLRPNPPTTIPYMHPSNHQLSPTTLSYLHDSVTGRSPDADYSATMTTTNKTTDSILSLQAAAAINRTIGSPTPSWGFDRCYAGCNEPPVARNHYYHGSRDVSLAAPQGCWTSSVMTDWNDQAPAPSSFVDQVFSIESVFSPPTGGGGGGRSAPLIQGGPSWPHTADLLSFAGSDDGVPPPPPATRQQPQQQQHHHRILAAQNHNQSPAVRPPRVEATPTERKATGGGGAAAGQQQQQQQKKNNVGVFRVLITCLPHRFTKDDVYNMVQLLYGRRMTVPMMTRYHLLVARVLLLSWKSFNAAKLNDAVKNQSRLTGAMGFTAHRAANSHFFSLVIDFGNRPSPESECWPLTTTTTTTNPTTTNTASSPTKELATKTSVSSSTAASTSFNVHKQSSFLTSESKSEVYSSHSSIRSLTSFADRLAELTREQDIEHWRDSTISQGPNRATQAEQLEGPLGAPRLLSVHPSVDCNACDCAHIQEGNYWVAWNIDLPELPAQLSDPLELCYTEAPKPRAARPSREPIIRQWTPFCCRKIAKMHHRRLRRDGIFQSIVAHRGSQPDIVFAVKTMKVSAGVYDERFFQLVNDTVVSVEGPFHTKIHAFKNYYCSTHQYWFSIDLFKKVDDDTDWEQQEEAVGEEDAISVKDYGRSTGSVDESSSSVSTLATTNAATTTTCLSAACGNEVPVQQRQPSTTGEVSNHQQQAQAQKQIHRHCMRMSPFTHVDNWIFIEHFFESTGFP